jgi:hypothetical protein
MRAVAALGGLPFKKETDRYGRVLGEHQRLLLEAGIVEQATRRRADGLNR